MCGICLGLNYRNVIDILEVKKKIINYLYSFLEL